jgi:hypothetical protein
MVVRQKALTFVKALNSIAICWPRTRETTRSPEASFSWFYDAPV